MHRCNTSYADLLLDTRAWRFLDLAEAETIHRTLAASKGAHWPHWAATRRRLQALHQHWGADEQTREHTPPPPRQRPLFPLHPGGSGQGGA